MIRKIAHLADIHIRKSTDRHDEYRKVFDKLYDDLIKESPDRIVIVGDLYDNYIDIEGEALLLTGEFLTKLSNISPVIVTVGNHEIRKDHLTRINTVETVISLMKHSGITYYNKTGFYEDENVIWSVWDHVDKGNPWLSDAKKDKSKIYIDLYHNPINGSTLFNGMKIKGKYPNVSDFKGDYSFLGDIHKRQFFKNKTNFSSVKKNFSITKIYFFLFRFV